MCNGLRETCAELVQRQMRDDYGSIAARAKRVLDTAKPPANPDARAEWECKMEILRVTLGYAERVIAGCRDGCAWRKAYGNVAECCNNIERRNPE